MKIRGRRQYLQSVIDLVREHGPLTASDLPAMRGPKRKPGDWHRSVPRWALEVHFGEGAVSVVDRLPNFQRVYDLAERVVDEPHFGMALDREESQRALLERSARALGVATLQDLADYYRMSPREAAPRVAELVEAGALVEASVEGWAQPAYLHPAARVPRRIDSCSLLSPFDPVVWFRPRAERLFDFHYRIEIYVPAAKRRWGYYVLPFLHGDRIVARVDLKADRQNSELQVLASHREDHAGVPEVCDALASELRTLANWLGLERLRVGRRGDLARDLARHCR